MANPNPDHYVIRVNARPVESPTTNRTVSGTLTFAVSRCPDRGKGQGREVGYEPLVVRPGDSIAFELGDVPFESKKPELRISWRFPVGKRWKDAPKRAGKVVVIPANSGFAGSRFAFDAKIDLNIDIGLPSQSTSRRGSTLIQLDPDVIVDEC